MLTMLLSLMFRPVSMSTQDSVQELLRHRFSPSLLRRDSCCVNQCFPFILQKNENAQILSPAINLSMHIDIYDLDIYVYKNIPCGLFASTCKNPGPKKHLLFHIIYIGRKKLSPWQ